MTREQAEHFWPLNPKADATTPATASSSSASALTTIESLPPISEIVRLIQIWPGCAFAACSAMSRATFFEPVDAVERVKAMKRVFGCCTIALPKVAPEPGQKLTTPGGRPASSRTSTKRAAMVGESLDGLRMTVLPAT